MSDPIQSLTKTGTRLWLDSIDPELVVINRKMGATGATSNPIIVSNLIATGRFDDQIEALRNAGHSPEEIAWSLTDSLVSDAQEQFLDVWKSTSGNDGYVSFELDPLLEDETRRISHDDRVRRYVELGQKWAEGHSNRMIKVPATPAGLAALEELCASGITLNVTLIFTEEQYVAARDAVWRGAQRRKNLENFKSVYSIFVSRVDVYSAQHHTDLSPKTQGMVGIINAKRIWDSNTQFWANRNLPLQQEIVFASTGTKNPEDPPWKYVAALAGGDIQTNPPATNQAIANGDKVFSPELRSEIPPDQLTEIERIVDFENMQKVLMKEGVEKFVKPQLALINQLQSR